MINRIVRMTFDPKKTDEFIEIFNDSKLKIASFPGNHGLKLLQDANENNVFYTYSLWSDNNCLEKYRKSDLFKTTWLKTRILFIAKAQAWSTNLIDNVK
jgi:heme-degrading monooxygenase HmoA